MAVSKQDRRNKIRKRVRKSITGTASRPRLSVFRSNKEIYAQLIDDVAGVTLTGISSGVGALAEEQGFTSQINIENIFLAMVLIQGLFAGLMIGKFSEGDILKGIKHSLILMASGYLIITLTLSII